MKDADSEEDEEDDDQDDEEVEENIDVAEAVEEPISHEIPKTKRPKERRKVTDPEDMEMAEAVEDLAEDVELIVPIPETEAQQQSIPAFSTAPLPSFPAPVVPDAPSKSDLALQGLDRALVDAELVDPEKVLPIPDEGETDAGSGLSLRTRRRLKDLGIVELFAGTLAEQMPPGSSLISCLHAVQTSLLPFLLPSDPLRRALYLPYNPPRDVCVSAPTGSGKTLAYVLPIVEVRIMIMYSLFS